MTTADDISDRLAQFRREWPRTVRWSEVRAADARAFRTAATGMLLIIPAVLCTLVCSALLFSFPGPLVLPAWAGWAQGILSVALFWMSIGLWLGAAVCISRPGDVKRGIAVSRFASERGLSYGRYGIAPASRGVLLAGGSARNASAPLYRAEFAVFERSSSREASMQIAIAHYTGGKNDAKGPRNAFRYMEMRLPRRLPHLMIDARGNGSVRAVLPGSQRLSLEGDFDRYFTVYVPAGYEQDALQLLTPDVMACLIDHGRSWDIEIVDDRLIAASARSSRSSDRAEYTAMLRFSELIIHELGRQAAYYTDPRAQRPRTQVSEAGARLRRRSGAWTAVAVAVAVAVMLGYPFVLGWFLDR